MKATIFKDENIPFVEFRYVENIPDCTKMHLHEQITLTAIKRGSLNLSFNKYSFELLPEEIAIINRDIPHCATINKKAKDGYVLYLDEKYLLDNGLQCEFSYELIKDVKFYNDFINLYNSLLDNKASVLEKKENILFFCDSIFSLKEEKILEKKFNLSDKIKEYLDLYYLDDISLEELAQKFQISVVHLIRVFKNDFGLPIHSYILNKKVHKAKELLLNNMPIIEVAQNSGFFDQSHLNRSFKRIFQLTPKQFQKNIKC
ncbi:AraC family transcriptional regulator [Halarcobacter ebronensis]|uniref:AraC family transcriptional regulator n=1 Tax=Halarcobacter ebronensis TaxID=1462615 RepID=A0A4Q1AQB5_9BACT|nr:AraC family transcriptional regulator [Halarcobacter ebronensis]QKF81550.1 transcriptional regulator, AraC family [Halarcobacter ebronensis]RXJ66496.1 AraC family transcriptional regulator [Halarcobacter ebronensis]RXK05478.1 AraC family transcriptional regulator [Halarcobacter ebronensis]